MIISSTAHYAVKRRSLLWTITQDRCASFRGLPEIAEKYEKMCLLLFVARQKKQGSQRTIVWVYPASFVVEEERQNAAPNRTLFLCIQRILRRFFLSLVLSKRWSNVAYRTNALSSTMAMGMGERKTFFLSMYMRLSKQAFSVPHHHHHRRRRRSQKQQLGPLHPVYICFVARRRRRNTLLSSPFSCLAKWDKRLFPTDIILSMSLRIVRYLHQQGFILSLFLSLYLEPNRNKKK